MFKHIKGFIIGFVSAIILMAGVTSHADSVLKVIQVAEDSINIRINGVPADVPNFVYDGRTYIQVRTLSELLGKNVSWDGSTKTASIDDKSTAAASTSQAKDSNVQGTSQLSTQEIAKKSSSVVLIKIYDANGNLIKLGSGFIVTPDGKVITNYHVIDGAVSIQVITNNNQVYDSDVLNYDQNKDIAILTLRNAAQLPAVTLGDSNNINLGEQVVAIGNPEGLQSVVSEGIISTTNRVINGQEYIQITAPISPGSSGGALFDSYGDVIGITSGMLSNGESINFAIPINYIKPLLNG